MRMFCVILILILLIIISLLGFSMYCKQSSGLCNNSKHLVGKVVIVTGASSGIGFETALDLAQRGARVILANRNEKNGTSARDKIIAQSGNSNVHYQRLDLSSFKSIRKFANNIFYSEQRLDILINNAGVIYGEHKKTEDGLLAGMQINYFGPFLLTNLLLPLLIKTAPSRIINVSSMIYKYGRIDLADLNMETRKSYIAKHFTYPNAKLCVTFMTVELDRRLQGTGVTVNVLHPGCIESNIMLSDMPKMLKIGKLLFGPFLKSTRMGAQTTIHLAVSPELIDVSGCYFEDCNAVEMSSKVKYIDVASKLWSITEKIVHLR